MTTGMRYVRQHQKTWKILLKGQYSASFDSRNQAVAAAIDAARADARPGHDSEVLVDEGGGDFDIVWMSSRDK